MSLSIRLVPVVLHRGVVSVEPDLKARYRDNAVDNSLSAAQPPACGQEVMTILAIVVDDDPHLPVVVEICPRPAELLDDGQRVAIDDLHLDRYPGSVCALA
jgi:hypothetical protein